MKPGQMILYKNPENIHWKGIILEVGIARFKFFVFWHSDKQHKSGFVNWSKTMLMGKYNFQII